MAEIFLSYRRQDSLSATGRLADRLQEHFGTARVFRDHDSIVAGEDFADAIRRAVAGSVVLLVVLGPRWASAADATGARRLDDPRDFVRLEIELALESGVPVVPVLVEGASMPPASALPPSLAAFTRCQAVELSETRWRYDAERLIEMLQSRFAIASEAPALGSAGDGGARPGSGRIARLALDVLDLAAHPTRLIARRQTGRAKDLLRALLFLLGSIAVGNGLLLAGLDLHPSPGTMLPGQVAGIAGWLFSGELVGCLVVALLAVPLGLAWRLVRRGAEMRQVALIGAYVYSGAWLGFCVGALLIGTGVQLVEPGLLDRLVATLSTPTAGASDARWDTATAAFLRVFHGPAPALALLSFAVFLGTAVWTVVAWGAFRQAFVASRLQAIGATLLWLATLAGMAWLIARVS